MQLATPFSYFYLCFSLVLFALSPAISFAQLTKFHELPIVTIEHFGNCPGCPAYEMGFFEDGTSYFIGRDAVRAMGNAGSVTRRDGFGTTNELTRKIFRSTLWWLDTNRSAIRRIVDEALSNLAFERDPAFRNKEMYCFLQSSVRGDVSEQALPLVSLTIRSVAKQLKGSFCNGPLTPLEIRRFIARVEALYEYPKDKVQVPPFVRNPDAVVRYAWIWENGAGYNPCERGQEDYVLILARDGGLTLSGQRTPSVEATDHYPTYSSQKFTTQVLEVIQQLRKELPQFPNLKSLIPPDEKIGPPFAGQETAPALNISLHVKTEGGDIIDLTAIVRPMKWYLPGKIPPAFQLLEKLVEEAKELLPRSNRLAAYCKKPPISK